MQEGMSFLCGAEVPVTLLNVSRGGPGIGSIQPGQADYNQVTRGGGNGDYRIPVFAPASIQEAVDILYEAPGIADKYRNPVMVLADGLMGQMMEPVTLPEPKHAYTSEEISTAKPWAISGSAKGERSVVKSLRLQPEVLEAHVEHLYEKYAKMEKELERVECEGLEDAEVVFVAFGTMARLAREAIELLGEQGVKAGLIRPISLWPYPYSAFDRLSDKTRAVVSVELSMGQMIEDVRLSIHDRKPVRLVNRAGGMIPSPDEVLAAIRKMQEEV
jgi:2-oxoglutarate ferredoxin oxidoreductase subunit alpha